MMPSTQNNAMLSLATDPARTFASVGKQRVPQLDIPPITPNTNHSNRFYDSFQKMKHIAKKLNAKEPKQEKTTLRIDNFQQILEQDNNAMRLTSNLSKNHDDSKNGEESEEENEQSITDYQSMM